MSDVQVVKFLDQVATTGFSEVGGLPRRLRVDGADFAQVEQVFLNGELSPFFEVKSSKRLLADIPLLVGDTVVTDVMVLSAGATLTTRSLLEMSIGSKVSSVSGIQKLLQTFMRLLLRTPGTNVFSPRTGGGIGRLIGKNYTAEATRLRSDAVAAVDHVRRQIITVQATEQGLPLSERLLSAAAKGVALSAGQGTLSLSVEVVSQSGLRGLATLLG